MSIFEFESITMKADNVYIDLDRVTGLDSLYVDSDTKVTFHQNPMVAISPSHYLQNYTMSVGSLARHLGLSPKVEVNSMFNSSWLSVLYKLLKL